MKPYILLGLVLAASRNQPCTECEKQETMRLFLPGFRTVRIHSAGWYPLEEGKTRANKICTRIDADAMDIWLNLVQHITDLE
jgi:hypothetical protein